MAVSSPPFKRGGVRPAGVGGLATESNSLASQPARPCSLASLTLVEAVSTTPGRSIPDLWHATRCEKLLTTARHTVRAVPVSLGLGPRAGRPGAVPTLLTLEASDGLLKASQGARRGRFQYPQKS